MTTDTDTGPERVFGWPEPLWRWLDRHRPPLRIFEPRAWRSPVRGPWLTSVFSLVLLLGLTVVIITGLMSYSAYEPRFAGNAFPPDPGWLRLPYFAWPTSPSWLYRLNQGLHVGLGLVLVPVVLAKLWSVIPKLFEWPPARSLAQLVERLNIALIVASVIFVFATGILDIQYEYVFGFSFYTGHYYGAWIFIGSFLAHVAIKLPTMVRSLRSRAFGAELRTSREQTQPEPPDPDELVAVQPSTPTISRRGVLALVGGSSLSIAALTVGQTIDSLRPTALLAPRRQSYGGGPTDFQVNRTFASTDITRNEVDGSWRLSLLAGDQLVVLTRDELLAMPQHTADLPIACVEGWSTSQTWTGVRLRDLAQRAGVRGAQPAEVISLETNGAFNRAMLGGQVFTEPDALLALKVNGVDLSLDHGYPARVIVPALPGVHNTKWVRTLRWGV